MPRRCHSRTHGRTGLKRESGANPGLPRSGKRKRKPSTHWSEVTGRRERVGGSKDPRPQVRRPADSCGQRAATNEPLTQGGGDAMPRRGLPCWTRARERASINFIGAFQWSCICSCSCSGYALCVVLSVPWLCVLARLASKSKWRRIAVSKHVAPGAYWFPASSFPLRSGLKTPTKSTAHYLVIQTTEVLMRLHIQSPSVEGLDSKSPCY